MKDTVSFQPPIKMPPRPARPQKNVEARSKQGQLVTEQLHALSRPLEIGEALSSG